MPCSVTAKEVALGGRAAAVAAVSVRAVGAPMSWVMALLDCDVC